MQKQLYFNDVTDIEKLYLKYVFLEFEGNPIIFICTDKKNDFYLCQCSEIRGLSRWIITKTTYMTIEQLINKEIDIYTAIKMNGERKWIYEAHIDDSTCCKIVDFDKINPLFLPEKHVFLEYADNEATEQFLNDEKPISRDIHTLLIDDDFQEDFNNVIYKNFFFKSEFIDYPIAFMSEVTEFSFEPLLKNEYQDEDNNISLRETNLSEAA